MSSGSVTERQQVDIAVAMAVDKPFYDNESEPVDPLDSNEMGIEENKSIFHRNWLLHDSYPLHKIRYAYREYFAEFFGTMLLICFGNGVVATTTFNGPNASPNASYLAVTFGWGMGLAMALFVSMGASGGHLNPAVSFANSLLGTFPWRKLPGYIIAQILGAMTGAACVYGLFKDNFDVTKKNLQPNETMTDKVGGIFCTYPGPHVSLGSAVWSETLNTMILLMCIMGICDEDMTPAINFKPIAVGMVVFVLGITTGINSGYAMNPARDLGPRITSALIFNSSDPFTKDNHYFWVPTFIPFFGAVVGCFLYAVFIIPPKSS